MGNGLYYILLAITSSAVLIGAVYLDAKDWKTKPSPYLIAFLVMVLFLGFVAGHFIKSDLPGWMGFCLATAVYILAARHWRKPKNPDQVTVPNGSKG